MLFGIKSALTSKKNLIASLSIIKSYSDEVTDFYDEEIPKVDSNHTFIVLISFDSTFNKDG